jgi:hypothetical protein
MVTMTWTSAPAGFLRAGGFDVRYRRCAAAAASVQGRGLPVAGAVLPLGTPMTSDQFGITNGTTLGYRSPGRPTS